jgi:putative Mg2+ transporter-C (MgtC) family protein
MTWELFHSTITSPYITVESTMFKILLSFIAGGLVGLNREQHKQAAGFRTHILICVGATLLMVLSIYIPQTYFDFKNGDPSRIAAQVVSGIGFLGAGAIMKLGNNIRGITTAASIWLISAVGLTIGAGLYSISFIVVGFALFTLILLERFERRWISKFVTKTFTLEFNDNNYPDADVKLILEKLKIEITDFSLTILHDSSNSAEVKLIVRLPASTNISTLINTFNELRAIKSFKIT